MEDGDTGAQKGPPGAGGKSEDAFREMSDQPLQNKEGQDIHQTGRTRPAG